jgi:hypothetical protein
MLAMLGFGLCTSCYVGAAVGPAFPTGAPPSSAGADAAFELGLTYDYKRMVRVMFVDSLQQFDGAVFEAGGQHLVVPLDGALGVDVTAWRFSPNLLLRGTARGYYGSGVRVGVIHQEVKQPGTHAFGGLLGLTLHLASTPDKEEGLGPAGLSATLGVLVAHADAGPFGGQGFVAPMLLLGAEFSPPHMIYCWLIAESCPHVQHGAQKN